MLLCPQSGSHGCCQEPEKEEAYDTLSGECFDVTIFSLVFFPCVIFVVIAVVVRNVVLEKANTESGCISDKVLAMPGVLAITYD